VQPFFDGHRIADYGRGERLLQLARLRRIGLEQRHDTEIRPEQ
jgi:hypothetical protein